MKRIKCFVSLILVFCFVMLTCSTAFAAPCIIDDYITVHSLTDDGSKLVIKYTIKKTGLNLGIRVDYPNARYNTLPQRLNTKKGTYTLTLNSPNKGTEVRIILTSNRTNKLLKQYYNPEPRKAVIREITQKDLTCKTLYNTACSLIVAGVSILTGGTVGIVLTLADIGISTTISLTNKLEVGQYYLTETWYENGKLYARARMWDSKQDYLDNKKPKQDSKTTLPMQKFTTAFFSP